MNRLDLDFSLNNINERNEYVQKYVRREEFKKKPLTPAESETIASYILWGKEADGKSAVQKKEFQIDTKNSQWYNSKKEESLDGLLENPTFNENMIMTAHSVRTKTVKETFSREKALATAPPDLIPVYKDLFHRIDELDLILNFYDLQHGRRKTQPRQKLLNSFSPEQILEAEERASHINQFAYLKMRHLLVELRQEQFSIKDAYSSNVWKDTQCDLPVEWIEPDFEEEISVFPLGVGCGFSQILFQSEGMLVPENFTKSQLNQISKFYWKQKDKFEKIRDAANLFYIDFRNEEHLYLLIQNYLDLEDAAALEKVESNTNKLLKTLNFYIQFAGLTPAYKMVLDLKIEHKKNTEIAKVVNEKFEKNYTDNYISTIFKQKILKQIAEAAAYHERIIGSLFFPEEFKTCTCCGKELLIDARNFVRKKRSKDGFTSRCKECDKLDRRNKKENGNDRI